MKIPSNNIRNSILILFLTPICLRSLPIYFTCQMYCQGVTNHEQNYSDHVSKVNFDERLRHQNKTQCPHGYSIFHCSCVQRSLSGRLKLWLQSESPDFPWCHFTTSQLIESFRSGSQLLDFSQFCFQMVYW